MKKFLFLLMAICLIVSVGASVSLAGGPAGPPSYYGDVAAHPNFSTKHKIEAYVEPFAKVTWGEPTVAYLQGDGSASSFGSIGVWVEANTSVKVDISGDGFTSKQKLGADYKRDQYYYLQSFFSLDNGRHWGTPSSIIDDSKKYFNVSYIAVPYPAKGYDTPITATHAGEYEGNVYVTITNVSPWNVRGPWHHAGSFF